MDTGDVRKRRFVSDITTENVTFCDEGTADIEEDVPLETGLMMLCKISLGIVIGLPLIFFVLLAVVMPNRIDPIEFSLPEPPKLTGVLLPNKNLTSAQKLFEGKLIGPESVIYRHGHIYTGTADGKILHIERGEIETIAELGKPPCGRYQDEPTCGRPLGMRFDKDGYLIVADAYLGIHRVNVATGDTSLILPATTEVEGRPFGFINDLAIAENGDIYFSDSSKYQRRDYILDMMEGRGSGRLLRYTPETSTVDLLVDGLYFANGVQLPKNDDYVLVAETSMYRIMKYHLMEPKKGQTEVFIDNLPCGPDNIRRSESGGYWVGCGVCRDGNKWFSSDSLAHKPWVRAILAKLPPWFILSAAPTCGMVLEINNSGQIIHSLMDLDGKHLHFISEVEEDNGILYLGSFANPYIAKINFNLIRKHQMITDQPAQRRSWSQPCIQILFIEIFINMAEQNPSTQTEGDAPDSPIDEELEQRFQELNKDVQKEMDSKMNTLRSEATSHLDSSLSKQMASASKTYETSVNELVGSRQTDILRMNKIFRDVARTLGVKWRPVFASLTKGIPEQAIAVELRRIEQQRPFMQAYKALTSWKEMMKEKFQMQDLVNVLKEHDFHDLALSVQETMKLDYESLVALKDKDRGVASGQARSEPVGGEEGGLANTDPAHAPVSQVHLSHALDDKNLLKLAKAVGGSWMDFARALQLPEDEIQQVLKTDGMSYQSVFKILWNWRDRVEDNITQDNIAVLKEALRKSGRPELADSIGQ